MSTGRPPLGTGHVERLEGPEELKGRLKVLLQTLTGELTTMEACERLGVGASRLHAMRREALEGALAALVPGRAGRPPLLAEETGRERQLEAQVKDLKLELQAALTRTEIALAMPHLYQRGSKKNSKVVKKARRRKGR